MQLVFLPMAEWPLKPLSVLNMRLDSTRVE